MFTLALTAWLLEVTLGCCMTSSTPPATSVGLYPLSDLIFIKGLKGVTLTQEVLTRVTVWAVRLRFLLACAIRLL